MVRRTHWYLLLLLGTVLGIVSCSSQTTGSVDAGNQNAATPVTTKRAEIQVQVDPAMTGSTMQTVTVTNKDTQQAEQFTVPVIPGNYKSALQYAQGHLFVLLPSGNNAGDLSKTDWTESLWRYPTSGSGVRLLEGRGLRTRISMNGAVVASASLDGVKILRSTGSLLTKPMRSVIGDKNYDAYLNRVTVMPVAVSSMSSWFYFYADKTIPTELIRIDNASGALERFPFGPLQVQQFNDVEPVSGRVVFWDRAPSKDDETAKEQNKMPSVIRMYDAPTKKNRIIAELPAGILVTQLYWEDETTVLYKDGSETRRITVE